MIETHLMKLKTQLCEMSKLQVGHVFLSFKYITMQLLQTDEINDDLEIKQTT